MPIHPFAGATPHIAPTAFIAPDSRIIGNVSVAEHVSIFFGAVLRGDLEAITIGEGSNLQEHCICHTTKGASPCVVGKNVTVGHRVTLHGCRIADSCIIGMGSTLLDGAVVEARCIVGAHSLVTKGSIIPEGSLALGSPAKVIRPLRPEEIEEIERSARGYQKLGAQYRLL